MKKYLYIYVIICISSTMMYSKDISEIFSYNDPAPSNYGYTIATAQNSNTVAIHAGTSPILIQNVDNDSKFYCSETYRHDKEKNNEWQRMQFYSFFDNDTKFFGKFHDLNDETKDSAFIYDLTTKSLLKYYSEDRFIHGISDDGSLFFSQDLNSKTLRLRSTATQEIIASLQIEYKVQHICYPKESNIWCVLFYDGNYNPLVIFYEKNTNKEEFRYAPPIATARDIRLSHNGLYCAISGNTSNTTELIIYSTRNRNVFRKHSYPFDTFGFTSCADFSENDESYAFGTDHVINVVRTSTGEQIYSSVLKHLEFGRILGLRWLPDNKGLVIQGSVERGFYTSLVNITTNDYRMLALPALKYLHVFDAGNKVLFMGDETVCYDRISGKILWNFTGYIPPRAFEIDEKNNRIVLTFNQRTIFVVRISDGIIEDKINTQAREIFCVRLSKSKKHILYLDVKQNQVYIYNQETKIEKIINVPLSALLESYNNEPKNVYWDDVQTKRIIVQYSAQVCVLNEDGVSLTPDWPTNSHSYYFNDELFKPEYSTLGMYRGKVFFNDKPMYLSRFGGSTLSIYDYSKDSVVLDAYKQGIFFRFEDDANFALHFTLDENDKKIIMITDDTLLRQWDIASNKEVMRMKLPILNFEYGWNTVVGYSLVHANGVSTVATLTDKRRVVFMEIPDSPVSVEEENISPTQEIESYPQPIHVNDGHFFMKVPMADIESISAISVLGEIVPLEFVHTDASTYRIMLPSLSRGHYTVQIKTQSGQALVHSILIL